MFKLSLMLRIIISYIEERLQVRDVPPWGLSNLHAAAETGTSHCSRASPISDGEDTPKNFDAAQITSPLSFLIIASKPIPSLSKIATSVLSIRRQQVGSSFGGSPWFHIDLNLQGWCSRHILNLHSSLFQVILGEKDIEARSANKIYDPSS